uniref:Uncharacterized protein n=1 Tax=Cacopsylla melanoneura TaxID=428564 RepID=A0A8D8XJZ9_9HEMI
MENWRSVLDITRFFMKDDKSIINELIDKKLIKGLTRCYKCRVPQELRRHQSFKGNYGAFCKKCKRYSKLTKNTFFENTGVSYEIIMCILWCWCSHLSVQAAENMLNDVSHNTIVQYYRYFRYVLTYI